MQLGDPFPDCPLCGEPCHLPALSSPLRGGARGRGQAQPPNGVDTSVKPASGAHSLSGGSRRSARLPETAGRQHRHQGPGQETGW